MRLIATRQGTLRATPWQAITAAVVAVLPIVGLLTPSAGAAARSRAALVALVSAPVLPRATVRLGPLAAGAEIEGAVVLSPHDGSKLQSFVSGVTDPASPLFHHYLPAGAFARLFGPAPGALDGVRALLVASGLRVSDTSGDPLLVDFRGSAAAAEHAFRTGLESVRLPDGMLGRATAGSVRLPAWLAPSVTAVVGLDDLVRLRAPAPSPRRATDAVRASNRPRVRSSVTTTPVACASAAAVAFEGGITDTQVATSYGFEGLYGAKDLGAGHTVDLFELQPFVTSDIATFDTCYFGESHTSQVSVTSIDGGAGTGPGGEAELDIENISALAPASTIDVFEAPNSTWGALDTYAAIANADNASVVSTSWGICETDLQTGAPGTQEAESLIFEQTAAQGQTVFAASGDDGSDDCANQAAAPSAPDLSVDDPSSQPDVTSVGGTTFVNTGEPPSEIVWNDGRAGGAGGGGISETWAMPAWQRASGAPGVVNNAYAEAGGGTLDEPCSNDPSGTADVFHVAGYPTTLPSKTLCREVPDVSALADENTGISTYVAVEGGWVPSGGTSSAAPIWAAATAEVDASSWCSGAKGGVGFLSPVLYELAANATDYADSFNDVGKAADSGNNDSLSIGPAPGTTLPPFPATAGYDMASGLGTPRLTNTGSTPGLAELACQTALSSARPVVTAISGGGYGATTGGSEVAITGKNFGTTTGEVYFGGAPAAVGSGSWTGTSVEVTVPPYVVPEGSPSSAGGPVVVTVVSAAGVSSSPGASSVWHYLPGSSSNEPAVDFVGPSGGPPSGGNPNAGSGNAVTVYGSGFLRSPTPTVTFGGIAAAGVKVLSDSELRVVPPPDTGAACASASDPALCQVNVVVTVGGLPSAISTILPPYEGAFEFNDSGQVVVPPSCGCEVVPAASEYDYVTAPAINSVSPEFGSANGGTLETITGTGFDVLTLVTATFGSPGSQLGETYPISITPTQIQVMAPPSPTAPVTEPTASEVSVQTVSGTGVDPTYPAKGSFAYAGVPQVTSISAHFGPTGGGGTLTIGGSGLSDASNVSFFSRVDTTILPPSTTALFSGTDASLKVTIPSDFAVPTDAEVCSATACSGRNPSVDVYTFAYPGQPTVKSFTPTTGPAQGGTTVTITGTELSEVVAVFFGKVASPSVRNGPGFPSGDDPTEVIAVAPPGAAGSKEAISVETVGGEVIGKPTSAPSTSSFTYGNSPPSAPQSVTASVSGATVTATWKAPASDGGSPVTSYKVVATSKGQTTVTVSVSATTFKDVFTKLKAGVPWVISVTALSKFGTGLTASATPVTPA